MRIVGNQQEIKNLHKRLVRSLDKFKSEGINILTGHKGESLRVDAHYSEELNIWWSFGEAEGKSGRRYWNAFGLGRPTKNRLVNIICEINYPFNGINKRVAAAWLEDEGEHVLIHSGKIGGGRAGIGKRPFQQRYAGSFADLTLPELTGKYTEIGNLDNPRLPYQIKFFVEEVARIKAEIVSSNQSSGSSSDPRDEIKTTFTEEFSGTKEYENSGKVVSNCDHGLVVSALKSIVETRGYQVANDSPRDLYIYNNRPQITHVFEVKTAISSQSIFTAVGQLLVNNARISPKPKLIYVVPKELNNNLRKTLAKLDIIPLIYDWSNSKATFKNIEGVLKQ
ncbi:MAG: hypothetical protein IIA45_04465 [Bacteroidetes bacterium]|nr:hypothetical protein [Bacteroidota bacterium]